MASWGFNVTMTKVLVSYFPTVTMTSFRIFTAAITVIIILFITKKLRLPTKREFGLIFLASIFNIVIHHFFLSNGLKLTTGRMLGLFLVLRRLWWRFFLWFFSVNELELGVRSAF